MGANQDSVESLWSELVRLCNEQFETAPFKRLLGAKFSKERAQQYSIQMAYYVQNRRDCWGYVQGSAPLEIKKIIWEHEEDELIGRKREGKMDHITLAVKEGEVLGLTAAAFERTARLEGGEVCFSAWIRLAQRPWLEAIAGSAILEMRNSAELIQGGSLSRRIGAIFERDLGIPMNKQINNAEHVVMDVEHAHLLARVVRKYATTEPAQQAILRGASESLMIDRVYRGQLADLVEGSTVRTGGPMNLLEGLLHTLDQMVNDQFDSVEFKTLLDLPLTLERGRFYVVQNALYTANRRDCWGYVQGGAPLDVKRVIWAHESDELINDPRAGMDHYALTVKQGEVIGLKPEDFENAEIPAMVRACFYAWHHIAMRSHWLAAYSASHMLERRNNGKIVNGGGMSFRVGKKFENELGINLKRMISLDVHVVADMDHSENISEIFERYVKTPQDCEWVLQGARDSMAIDRAYRGALGFYMAQIQ